MINRLIASHLNNEQAWNYKWDVLKILGSSNNVSMQPSIEDDPAMPISCDDQPVPSLCAREQRHDFCGEQDSEKLVSRFVTQSSLDSTSDRMLCSRPEGLMVKPDSPFSGRTKVQFPWRVAVQLITWGGARYVLLFAAHLTSWYAVCLDNLKCTFLVAWWENLIAVLS